MMYIRIFASGTLHVIHKSPLARARAPCRPTANMPLQVNRITWARQISAFKVNIRVNLLAAIPRSRTFMPPAQESSHGHPSVTAISVRFDVILLLIKLYPSNRKFVTSTFMSSEINRQNNSNLIYFDYKCLQKFLIALTI